jgi:hypothetical protein
MLKGRSRLDSLRIDRGNIDEALVQRRRIATSSADSNSVAVSSRHLDQHFRE